MLFVSGPPGDPMNRPDSLRQLPRVDALLAHPEVAALPRHLAREAARELLDEARARILEGGDAPVAGLPAAVAGRIEAMLAPRLRPVINATGVVIHTNLGRAPWPPEALDAAIAVAGGYTNLEMDLDTGARGQRLAGISRHLRALTGAEAAVVVNNCAAAVLLALSALADGREVVVSRGELVEIGGSFRVPEIVTQGGARLVEVGTTNRTRIADFAAAVTDHTAVLLRVHPSNFRVTGFVEAAARTELVALGQARGLSVVEDLGSGSLDGERDEPGVRQAIADGVDLVLFSGDKLLGGPQAGIAVGTADAVARLRRHPLYRALRVDKVTLAALEATLAVHRRGDRTPVDRMIAADVGGRAASLASALVAAGVAALCEPCDGQVGGGSMPEQALAGVSVVLSVDRPDDVARRLRIGRPSVVCRIHDARLWFDLRTVDPELDASLLAAVEAATAQR